MSTWSWPTINAGINPKFERPGRRQDIYYLKGKSNEVYVEWGTSGSIGDDAGEAYYQLSGTSNAFEIQAKYASNFHLYVTLNGMATETNAKGAVIDEGFRHNAAVNWILSADESGAFWSNSAPPVDWMQQSLGSLGNRTLKHICMPGSHDAGMSSYSPGTVGANFENTQAQYLNIYNQLLLGSRYFDLRPVVSDGVFVSGHYSELDSVWVGGNGESMSDIIAQINQYVYLPSNLARPLNSFSILDSHLSTMN